MAHWGEGGIEKGKMKRTLIGIGLLIFLGLTFYWTFSDHREETKASQHEVQKPKIQINASVDAILSFRYIADAPVLP